MSRKKRRPGGKAKKDLQTTPTKRLPPKKEPEVLSTQYRYKEPFSLRNALSNIKDMSIFAIVVILLFIVPIGLALTLILDIPCQGVKCSTMSNYQLKSKSRRNRDELQIDHLYDEKARF